MLEPATTLVGMTLRIIVVGIAADVMPNGADVADATLLFVLSDTFNVSPFDALVRNRSGKLTMPAAAGRFSVPCSVSLAGLAARAIVMLSELLIRLPEASSIATRTPAGESMFDPAAVLVGGVRKTSVLESNRRDSRNSPVA